MRIQDKGSRFVILGKDHYISKMHSQLDNPLHYSELSSDPSVSHVSLVKGWGQIWLGEGQIGPEIAKVG